MPKNHLSSTDLSARQASIHELLAKRLSLPYISRALRLKTAHFIRPFRATALSHLCLSSRLLKVTSWLRQYALNPLKSSALAPSRSEPYNTKHSTVDACTCLV